LEKLVDDKFRRIFVRALCNDTRPEVLPGHYSAFYDRLAQRWSVLLSSREPDQRDWPLLSVLAEMFKEKDEQIDELGSRLKALEGDEAPVSRIDGRSREARAMRTGTLAAVGA
jgi:hypothetical protein